MSVETITISATEIITISGTTGPQGIAGPPGTGVPIFTRQNQINTLVGNSRFYFDATHTITQVRASVGTASTGSPIVVDTLVNGVSIGTTSIAAGTNTATLPVSHAVNSGDYVTVSILSIGSTYPGADLTVTLTVN